jgi:hypothetical protein
MGSEIPTCQRSPTVVVRAGHPMVSGCAASVAGAGTGTCPGRGAGTLRAHGRQSPPARADATQKHTPLTTRSRTRRYTHIEALRPLKRDDHQLRHHQRRQGKQSHGRRLLHQRWWWWWWRGSLRRRCLGDGRPTRQGSLLRIHGPQWVGGSDRSGIRGQAVRAAARPRAARWSRRRPSVMIVARPGATAERLTRRERSFFQKGLILRLFWRHIPHAC